MKEVIMTGSGNWVQRLSPNIVQEGFTPSLVIGRRSPQEAQARLHELGFVDAQYISPEEFADKEISSDAVGLVFSANENHVPDATLLLQKGVKKTAIDKPLAPSFLEARGLIDRYREQGGVLHAEDHYLPKVRSAEVLLEITRDDVHVQTTEGGKSSDLFGAIKEIGQIIAVEASIVEKGGIEGRQMLDNAKTGGVLLDLMIHLAAVGTRLRFVNDHMTFADDIVTQTYDAQSGKWRKVRKLGKGKHAEMFAKVPMIGRENIPVTFTVGKIGDRTDHLPEKKFRIIGSEGEAVIDFNGARTDVVLKNGKQFGTKLVYDAYGLIFRNIRATFEESAPDNIIESLTSLALIEQIRDEYNNKDKEKTASFISSAQTRPASTAV
jgi:hypothetical protein